MMRRWASLRLTAFIAAAGVYLGCEHLLGLRGVYLGCAVIVPTSGLLAVA